MIRKETKIGGNVHRLDAASVFEGGKDCKAIYGFHKGSEQHMHSVLANDQERMRSDENPAFTVKRETTWAKQGLSRPLIL